MKMTEKSWKPGVDTCALEKWKKHWMEIGRKEPEVEAESLGFQVSVMKMRVEK